MVTIEQADEAYRAARTQLTTVIWAAETTDAQRQLARAARDELLNEFLGQVAADVAGRTVQFAAFAANMRALVGGLGAGGPVAAIDELTSLVETAEKALEGTQKVVAKVNAVRSRGVRKARSAGGGGGGEPLRVLCVHGIGDHHTDTSWQGRWREAIVSCLRRVGFVGNVVVDFFEHDAVFAKYPLGFGTTASAIWKLTRSGIVHGLFGKAKARGDLSGSLRWSAGMVVQWAEDAKLRKELRELLAAKIAETKADVLMAHSLGSLIAYDTLLEKPGRLDGGTFVSFGSQIGNAFVRGTWGGRIRGLDAQSSGPERWFHLFNPDDHVFTAELEVPDSAGFLQVRTVFDAGLMNHDALGYLGHRETSVAVFRSLVAEQGARGVRHAVAKRAATSATATRPKATAHRALIVGINAYPDPKDRLEGCVNDAFAVSAMLQEVGFPVEGIRLLLDERATAAGIRERLDWLLEGADGSSQRVFYYSGHGAQIPGYGKDNEVDRIDECLVPYDFDWTTERAVIDDELAERYAQLPYDALLTMVFDCCHSGGVHKAGGPKARGLTAPDDIRHRAMRWDRERQMWVERDLVLSASGPAGERERFFGKNGASRLIGTAGNLRRDVGADFDAVCKAAKHRGPYMPVVLQACSEDQLAYEYRHGVESRGAFTYSLLQQMQHARSKGTARTFRQLVKAASTVLRELRYDQTPQIRGPKAHTGRAIPWLLANRR